MVTKIQIIVFWVVTPCNVDRLPHYTVTEPRRPQVQI
jgi:hypothetical protein